MQSLGCVSLCVAFCLIIFLIARLCIRPIYYLLTMRLSMHFIRRLMPSRKCVTAPEFVSMNICSPKFQRTCDDRRASEIERFLVSRKFLCGDIILSGSCSDGYWIIDGQHRAAAVRSAVSRGILNNEDGSIVALTIFAPHEATPEELFELVNMAIPVPEYIVANTLNSRRRERMHAVETYLRREFKEYVSDARSPRRPNFNPSQVVDAMMRSDALIPCTPTSSDEWCGLVEFVNTSILNEKDWSAHLKASARRTYVLAQWDPLHAWAASEKWADAWNSSGRPLPQVASNKAKTTTTNTTTTNTTTTSRAPIPVALRNAVWNTYAGGPEVGEVLCACCETTKITQQTFECGHVIAAAEGGACSVDNMRPVCRGCNRSMGKTNMNDFKRKHFVDVMDTDPVV